jgi:hypothetical protein
MKTRSAGEPSLDVIMRVVRESLAARDRSAAALPAVSTRKSLVRRLLETLARRIGRRA